VEKYHYLGSYKAKSCGDMGVDFVNSYKTVECNTRYVFKDEFIVVSFRHLPRKSQESER
jgi:hypothetical protein